MHYLNLRLNSHNILLNIKFLFKNLYKIRKKLINKLQLKQLFLELTEI